MWALDEYKMKRTLLVLALTCISVSALAGAPSHCITLEQVIYSCKIKNSQKVVSLCASKDLSAKSGYLQYRFGHLGKVELEFPDERKNSQTQFRYAHYFRFQIDRTEVSFKNAGYEYALYSYYDGEEKPPKSEAGVRVNKTMLPCGGDVADNLLNLKDVVRCDEDNSLGGCE